MRWSQKLIVGALREASARGIPLTTASFRAGLVEAIYRRFESWEACMKAAGLAAVYRRDLAAARASRLAEPRPAVPPARGRRMSQR